MDNDEKHEDISDDDCEHEGGKTFTEDDPTLAWYSEGNPEEDILVEVTCDNCGKLLHAYYNYNSVTEV